MPSYLSQVKYKRFSLSYIIVKYVDFLIYVLVFLPIYMKMLMLVCLNNVGKNRSAYFRLTKDHKIAHSVQLNNIAFFAEVLNFGPRRFCGVLGFFKFFFKFLAPAGGSNREGQSFTLTLTNLT